MFSVVPRYLQSQLTSENKAPGEREKTGVAGGRRETGKVVVGEAAVGVAEAGSVCMVHLSDSCSHWHQGPRRPCRES